MTRPLPLYRRALGDSRRSLIGWSLGFLAALLLYVPLYSSIGSNPDMAKLLDSLPPALVNAIGYGSISTGAGYVSATFYGLMGFALATIAAVAWSTAAIAGDEEVGSLELTLAHGVTRTQVVLERSAAIVTRLLWLCLLSALVIMALNGSAKLNLDFAKLAAISAALLGLSVLTALVGIAVGALTGRRVWATGASAGVAVGGYALNAVANQSSDLDWLHQWSPYAWAFHNAPLSDGADWAGLGLLFGLSVALLAIAVVALNRRDIIG
ncbi:ABC transporter permease subunit [Schumannella luteola]